MSTIRELYISVDVEADGPTPMPYSMASLGATVAGFKDADGSIVRLDMQDPQNSFYAELKPISDMWMPESLAVSGLEREHLESNGEDPAQAMTNFSIWVNQMVATYDCKTAVFCAFPLGFDWMWVYWYLENFSEFGSPFGHSRGLDIKTLYMAKSSSSLTRSTKTNIPKTLRSKLPHTHNALDDAKEQGELLMNLLEWEGKPRL